MGGKRLDGLRVLLVDDDADSLDTMCLVLTLHGAEVRGLRTAPQGLVLVREFRPHVRVSDLSMPGEDGGKPVEPDRVVDAVARLAAPAR